MLHDPLVGFSFTLNRFPITKISKTPIFAALFAPSTHENDIPVHPYI